MNNLIVKASKTTPEINFNFETGILCISGESYPENSKEFYAEPFQCINRAVEQKKELSFNFKLTYFNTSSSKIILDIIRLLNNYHLNGGKVILNWFYEEDDEDIYDSGVEFTDGLELKCNFVSY